MNITPKDKDDKFNRILFERIDLNLYQYKFLNEYIGKAIKGEMPLYESSVINTTAGGWILILHGEMLLIYGDKWDKSQFQEIDEVFDLNKYTNFTLSGDNELIDELIKFYKPMNVEIEKRRLLYKSANVNLFNPERLQIRFGSFDKLVELAEMLQQYYHEEYNGLNDKTIEEMKQRISSIILTRKIYCLFDVNDSLLAFCTIIDPDIGILFTKKEHRNKGYGKVILSHCSRQLQQKNGIVYVMTDQDKIESNIVCEAVGFKPYFKYVMTSINCG